MARQPNVVVFLTDQQRWDCSALHGNPLDLMPNFDRLAAGGTHIANSFSCQPVCAPVRSTLQLGRYATNTGVWKNGLNPDRTLPSLAGQFNEAGYTTSYIGKWHLYDRGEGPPGPVPKESRLGYQRWLASNLLEFTSDAYQTTLYNDDDEPVELYGYRVDACVDAAIRDVVELSKSEQPFFLFLSLIEPHHQNSRDDYPAPEGLRSRYEGRWMPPDLQHYRGNAHQHIAGYYGMVKRIDDALG
ncbi:MAG: sulfatase-like hydrolase/transferase, partial [Spirochaetaceae bacterium]